MKSQKSKQKVSAKGGSAFGGKGQKVKNKKQKSKAKKIVLKKRKVTLRDSKPENRKQAVASSNLVVSEKLEGMSKLLEVGKARGFVTYDQINEYLSPEIISTDAIEDVLSLLTKKGIEIIDCIDENEEESELTKTNEREDS